MINILRRDQPRSHQKADPTAANRVLKRAKSPIPINREQALNAERPTSKSELLYPGDVLHRVLRVADT